MHDVDIACPERESAPCGKAIAFDCGHDIAVGHIVCGGRATAHLWIEVVAVDGNVTRRRVNRTKLKAIRMFA